MPIREDLKPLYPVNWQEIRVKILFLRAIYRCEFCGVKDRDWGVRDDEGVFWPAVTFDGDNLSRNPNLVTIDLELDWDTAFRIIICIVHLDHDVRNNDGMEEGGAPLPLEDANLVALCQQCHNRHDGPHRSHSKVLTWDKKKGQRRFDFET